MGVCVKTPAPGIPEVDFLSSWKHKKHTVSTLGNMLFREKQSQAREQKSEGTFKYIVVESKKAWGRFQSRPVVILQSSVSF